MILNIIAGKETVYSFTFKSTDPKSMGSASEFTRLDKLLSLFVPSFFHV